MILEIVGKYLKLRLVETEDAQFILDLRNNHKDRKNLSVGAKDVKSQIDWIEKYKVREAERTDFYFVIEKNHEQIGLIRVYDIISESFELGSLIVREGESIDTILDVLLLAYNFAFNTLKLSESRLRVKKENKSGNRFHKNYGAKLYKEDEELNYYNFGKESIDNLQEIKKMFS